MPTDAHPNGANGVSRSSWAWGSAASVATASSAASTAATPSWTVAETRIPAKFMAATSTISTPAVTSWVDRPPPVASATYAPAKPAAGGAPTGTAKKKHQPTTVAARAPNARRA